MTNGWDDPRNAELYDRFAREHALYRETSRDLVELAGLENAEVVVDLACGTGATTRAALERVGPSASIVALDASEAMLEIARRNVQDERVEWVQAPAVELPRHVSEADVIVCNSAIWQLHMEPATTASARSLRPGGRLAFNIGRQFLMLPLTEEELRPSKPTFVDLIQAIAILEHDFAPPHRVLRGGPLLTPESVIEMIRKAGLEPSAPTTFEYDNPPEAQLAWFKVPVFAENVLPGLDYETQVRVLDEAYSRLDKTPGPKNLWMAFLGTKP